MANKKINPIGFRLIRKKNWKYNLFFINYTSILNNSFLINLLLNIKCYKIKKLRKIDIISYNILKNNQNIIIKLNIFSNYKYKKNFLNYATNLLSKKKKKYFNNYLKFKKNKFSLLSNLENKYIYLYKNKYNKLKKNILKNKNKNKYLNVIKKPNSYFYNKNKIIYKILFNNKKQKINTIINKYNNYKKNLKKKIFIQKIKYIFLTSKKYKNFKNKFLKRNIIINQNIYKYNIHKHWEKFLSYNFYKQKLWYDTNKIIPKINAFKLSTKKQKNINNKNINNKNINNRNINNKNINNRNINNKNINNKNINNKNINNRNINNKNINNKNINNRNINNKNINNKNINNRNINNKNINNKNINNRNINNKNINNKNINNKNTSVIWTPITLKEISESIINRWNMKKNKKPVTWIHKLGKKPNLPKKSVKSSNIGLKLFHEFKNKKKMTSNIFLFLNRWNELLTKKKIENFNINKKINFYLKNI